MTSISFRFLAASMGAAALVVIAGTVDACQAADCNDTATCPIPSDDAPAMEGNDETVQTSDAIATDDMSDGALQASDATADASDAVADTSDSPVDTNEAGADVIDDADASDSADVGDSPAEGPPADTGRDGPSEAEASAPLCASNLLPLRAAVSSSVFNGNLSSFAIDGNLATRWESVQGIDPQWIDVDFGAPVFINRVRILWEGACAKNYDIQTSNDVAGWTTIKSIVGNANGTVLPPTDWTGATDHAGLTGVGRYLRIFGTVRCTMYGYSMYEMRVYGDPNAGCQP